MRSTFGRYKISEELGRGGMATVFHAHDPLFGRDVAIKVLPREFLHDTTFRERFEREARAIAQLEHHAIVPVYDFGEEDGQPYLVMRYMGGGSLADLIRKEEIPFERVLSITDRLAAALDRAHGKQIIHRDVKPANALFDEDGVAYLSDFGMVKLSEGPSALTGSGIVGTPFYMAPEMAEPNSVTQLVDVYALGVTAYQMFTRTLPFAGDTPISVLMGHLNNPVPDIRLLRPGLPEGIQHVMARVLAKSPEQRFQSAGDFSRGLAECFSSMPLDTRKLSSTQAAILTSAAAASLETANPSSTQGTRSLEPVAAEEDDGGTQVLERRSTMERTPSSARTPEPITLPPALAEKKDPQEKESKPGGLPLPLPVLIGGGALIVVILIVALIMALGGGGPGEVVAEATATTVEATATTPPTATPDPEVLAFAAAQEGVSSNAAWTPLLKEIDGVMMALVPAGCFDMGLAGVVSDAGPVHEQCFEEPFWIDVTEVSQAQFEEFGGEAVRPPAFEGEDLPRESVTWYEAVAYCEARGARLPSEREWEYATRGPDSLPYAWGEEFDCANGNFDDELIADPQTTEGGVACDGYEATGPVGSYPESASWVGALDLNGNVWEWVYSWYALYPYSPFDGRERAEMGDSFVQTMLRGAGFGVHQEQALHSAARLSDDPGAAYNFLGFRCAADFEAEE